MNLRLFLKKKLYLPLKWHITQKAKVADMEFQDLQKLLSYMDTLERKLVIAERENDRASIIAHNARIEMIDWFIYAKTKRAKSQ